MMIIVGGGIAFGVLWTQYECQIKNIFAVAFTAGLMSQDGLLTDKWPFYRHFIYLETRASGEPSRRKMS